MDVQYEKRILLRGIRKLSEEMRCDYFNLDVIKRHQQLVNCLIILNWRECGERKGEGLYGNQSNTSR